MHRKSHMSVYTCSSHDLIESLFSVTGSPDITKLQVFAATPWWVDTACASPPTWDRDRNRLEKLAPAAPLPTQGAAEEQVRGDSPRQLVFFSVPSEKHTRITAKRSWLYLKQSELYLKRGERRILNVVFEKKNKKEKKKKWPTRVCRFWDSPWPSWV